MEQGADRFCSLCGALCSLEVPEGDDRVRQVCRGCSTVHYENPRIVVGAFVLVIGGAFLSGLLTLGKSR